MFRGKVPLGKITSAYHHQNAEKWRIEAICLPFHFVLHPVLLTRSSHVPFRSLVFNQTEVQCFGLRHNHVDTCWSSSGGGQRPAMTNILAYLLHYKPD